MICLYMKQEQTIIIQFWMVLVIHLDYNITIIQFWMILVILASCPGLPNFLFFSLHSVTAFVYHIEHKPTNKNGARLSHSILDSINYHPLLNFHQLKNPSGWSCQTTCIPDQPTYIRIRMLLFTSAIWRISLWALPQYRHYSVDPI